jgi:hypothetical protein
VGQDWSGGYGGLEHPDPKPGDDLSPEGLAAREAANNEHDRGYHALHDAIGEHILDAIVNGLSSKAKERMAIEDVYAIVSTAVENVHDAGTVVLAAEVERLRAELDEARATALTLDREAMGYRSIGWAVVESDRLILQTTDEARARALAEAIRDLGGRAVEVFVRDLPDTTGGEG